MTFHHGTLNYHLLEQGWCTANTSYVLLRILLAKISYLFESSMVETCFFLLGRKRLDVWSKFLLCNVLIL